MHVPYTGAITVAIYIRSHHKLFQNTRCQKILTEQTNLSSIKKYRLMTPKKYSLTKINTVTMHWHSHDLDVRGKHSSGKCGEGPPSPPEKKSGEKLCLPPKTFSTFCAKTKCFCTFLALF